MARNVEIKARIEDLERTRQLVVKLADRGPERLSQTDTFFNVHVGRLKLREFSPAEAELIYYRRPNASAPTESYYERSVVTNSQSLGELLARELGIKCRVSKERLVYWVGRTRVHLDEVSELGTFLELEVVLDPGEKTEIGIREAERLMRLFEIHEDSLISEAYVDLLS
jgi:predicted adenylyl cyclase CyaB